MPAAKSFEATLEHSGNSLNWIIIRIPFAVDRVWGTRGQTRVRGEINGFAFRTSLFPTGKGTHYMIVNKGMQKGGKTGPGSPARFRMEPDGTEREIPIPSEWQALLKQSKAMQKFYESLNESMRREITRRIADAKHQETRKRRAEQLAEQLISAMEAQRELPPMIRVALDRNPKAQAGWKLMTPTHRRRHLLGIFYYRNPESRARRLAKAMKEMIEYAEKQKSKP